MQFTHQIRCGESSDRKTDLLASIGWETDKLAGLRIKGDLHGLLTEILAHTVALRAKRELSQRTRPPKPASLGQVVVHTLKVQQGFFPFQTVGLSRVLRFWIDEQRRAAAQRATGKTVIEECQALRQALL
jgi:hypothetical protein